MTFQPNKPQATDLLSQSWKDLQDNFSQSNIAMGIDHIAFDGGASKGEHKKVTFNNVLGADPGLALPKSSLYTKGATPELFFQLGPLATDVRQLTDLIVVTVPLPHGTAAGVLQYIDTPWKLRYFWCRTGNIGGGSTATIILPAGSGTILFQQTSSATAAGMSACGGQFAGLTITVGTVNAQILNCFAICQLP